LNPTCPWFAGRPHILRCCSQSWNAANASLNKALRNGGKRRRSPRKLALIEACRRLRPLEPICASTEINSSAVSPPFQWATIGKGHPQAPQKIKTFRLGDRKHRAKNCGDQDHGPHVICRKGSKGLPERRALVGLGEISTLDAKRECSFSPSRISRP
jgi:hypothetical protein